MVVDGVGRFLSEHGIAPQRIVIACSGGADSTALLLAFADLRSEGFEPICAHVNHHLRGRESDEDAEAVRVLAERLGVPVHIVDGVLDPDAVKERGIESAAREVRERALDEIRHAHGSSLVATAHQLDDQAETVLMRLFTGSGLAALRGIHPVRGDGFIRPLLRVPRAEIDRFVRERGITPRVDSSNADPRFLRNRVRAVLRGFDAAVVASIASAADQARDLWPVVEALIDTAERRACEIRSDETRFLSWPDDRWLRQALLNRHIRRLDGSARDVSARDVARLAASLDTIRRTSVSGNLELVRRGTTLILRRRRARTPDFEIALDAGEQIDIAEIGGTFGIARAAPDTPLISPDRRRQLLQLPRGADPTFTVRNRRRGDRLQPLGLGHEKKLKELLIDRKIAAEIRDQIPLLVWNDEIVWVAGIAISEKFKVTDPAGDLYEVWFVTPHEESQISLHR